MRLGARAAPLALALAAAAVAPAGAAARPATRAELAALAQRAGRDPGALARLLSVRSVDGQPVDVRAALSGASGAALAARLRLLAGSAAAVPAAPATRARADAAAILAERRFHGSSTPNPLHDVLAAIGRAIRWVLDPIGRLVKNVGARLPGGASGLWIALAALVLAAATLLTRTITRRRTAATERLARSAGGAAAGDDPRALEREAAEAERAGDRERALRLRFRAGLVRLGHAHLLELRPSLTTEEAARALRSPSFDALAATFEQVAYGGRAASHADLDDARRRWPAVIEEARAR